VILCLALQFSLFLSRRWTHLIHINPWGPMNIIWGPEKYGVLLLPASAIRGKSSIQHPANATRCGHFTAMFPVLFTRAHANGIPRVVHRRVLLPPSNFCFPGPKPPHIRRFHLICLPASSASMAMHLYRAVDTTGWLLACLGVVTHPRYTR
jgi:hypothetical protein